jgi:predicted metalloprotease with PDZ domain
MPHAPTHKAGRHRLALAAALAIAGPLAAAAPASEPVAYTAAVADEPAPRDESWPGTIGLAVDASDLDHRVQRVEEVLSVGPGPLTLLYPRFLPGTHGPYGDIANLAGLRITSDGGRPVDWRRDLVDPYAFHVEVPAGASALRLRFEHVSTPRGGQGRTEMTSAILGVEWDEVVLYPAGRYASAIRVQPRLKLPSGWQQASALRDARGEVAMPGADGWVSFAEASLETLVDSPLFAARTLKRIPMDPPGTAHPVMLNLVADETSQIEPSDKQLEAHRALVAQADKLYGARHWRHYDFLLAVSDHFGGIGLEHHESSENGVRGNYFTKDWAKNIGPRTLLPHEYTHAWNGKFRRPADLWTPQFNVAMRNSLLWVYEGMTQYWGHVLTARSGLASVEQMRDNLANTVAYLDHRPGRVWRNLQDTTNEATMAAQHGHAWRNWQRGADYYDEATLIWLDADTLIREKSGSARSLDDFARAFFGIASAFQADGSPKPVTYAFDDVVETLNAVQPYDWARFLHERLDTHRPGAPLDGLARSGWTLAWTDKETEFAKNAEGWGGADGHERPADFAYSLGLLVFGDGKIDTVLWDSPAFKAGLAAGETVIAVNMEAYKDEKLAAAVTANKDGHAPVQILVRDDDRFRTVTIDWSGGLRYPTLERIDGTPDRLSAIYAPK